MFAAAEVTRPVAVHEKVATVVALDSLNIVVQGNLDSLDKQD